MNNSPFMCSVRDAIRLKQMALHTARNYCYWIRFFVRCHKYASLEAIRGDDATSFLAYLVVTRHVSPNILNAGRVE